MSSSNRDRRFASSREIGFVGAALVGVVMLGMVGAAGALEPEVTPEREEARGPLSFGVRIDNVGLWRSDTDFDTTAPSNVESQHVGALATFLTPQLRWAVRPDLFIVYEADLALTYWSRQRADVLPTATDNAFVLKHREMFVERAPSRGFGFKAGYQRFSDASGLFVDHWMGLLQGTWRFSPSAVVGVFVGQVPDSATDGSVAPYNDLSRDIFLYGLRGEVRWGDALELAWGVHGLWDGQEVDQPLWIVAPNVRLTGRVGGFEATLDAVLQAGQHQGATVTGEDATVLAWALQLRGAWESPVFRVDAGVLALSPDDAYDGNDRAGAFRGSAKNRSRTHLLTEDERRDWYDNLDERMSTLSHGFWSNRAGLLVGDVQVAGRPLAWLEPSLTVGVAATLEPDNALGRTYVGTELEAELTFFVEDYLTAWVAGGVFLPGEAGAALLNGLNPDATDRLLTSGRFGVTVIY